jgi:hypothetical protein
MADPFTGAAALGAAANIVQVVLAGAHVLNRIRKFSTGQFGLPNALENASRRLDVLVATLDHLKDDETAAKDLHEFLLGVHVKIKKFDAILDKYLPKEGDTFSSQAKAAIQSFGKEKDISGLEDNLLADVNFLSAWQGSRTLQILTGKNENERSLDHLNGRTFYEIPHRRVANFIGRNDEIAKVYAAFEKHPVVVLQAMGGQGKTQLALEYCHLAKKAAQFRGIFWCNASSESALRKGLESIAELLKAPDQTLIGPDSGLQLTLRTLNLWNRPWLLVLDNYDEPHKFTNIRDYMPNSVMGRILITSRHHDSWRLGKQLNIPPMRETDALSLLLDSAGLSRWDKIREQGLRIVRRLGCLPLAVDQAGSYIRDRAGYASFEQFLERYEEEADKIWDKIPTVWEYAQTVFTTWEMAFSQIDQDTDEGAALASFIDLLGFFHHESISESLFETYLKSKDALRAPPLWKSLFTNVGGDWSHSQFLEAATRLKKLSIVSSFFIGDQGFAHISLHPLVSDWIKFRGKTGLLSHNRPSFSIATQILAHAMMTYYFDSQLLGDTFRMSLAERKAFLLHISVWENNANGAFRDMFPTWIVTDAEPIRSAEACFALFFDYCRAFQSSFDLATRLRQYCDQHPDEGSLDPMLDLTEDLLFEIHVFLGDLTKALEVATFIYDRRKQKYGQGHPSTLEAGNSLTIAFRFRCKHNIAEALCRQLIGVKGQPDVNKTEVEKQKERLRIELVSILQDKATDSSTAESDTLVDRLFKSAKKSHGIKWGSTYWNWRCYTTLLPLVRDTTLLTNLCQELLHLVKYEVGEHYFHFLEAKCYSAGAQFLLGMPVDAEATIQECLRQSRDTVGVKPHETAFFDMSMLGLLQAIFVKQRRFIEAETVVHELIARHTKDTFRDPASHAKQESQLHGALTELIFHQGRLDDAEAILESVFLTDTNSLMRLVIIKFEKGGPENIREASVILWKVIKRIAPIFEKAKLGIIQYRDSTTSLSETDDQRAAYQLATAEEHELGEEFELGAWSFFEILAYQAAALFMLGDLNRGHETLKQGLKTFYKYALHDVKRTREFLDRSSRVLKYVLDSKEISRLKKEALYDLWFQHRIICVHAWDMCEDRREEIFKRAERRVRSIKRIGNDMYGHEWSGIVTLPALDPAVVHVYLGENGTHFLQALERVSIENESQEVVFTEHNERPTRSLTGRIRLRWSGLLQRGQRSLPLR